jgi:hypothetical protein
MFSFERFCFFASLVRSEPWRKSRLRLVREP